ncbi:Bug family tripartite tricarboxylate transporter substrate binding protein [Azospirillum halopraeferens]|uniref:Bug family tripartite tricarboxylate transporter substrate binding protein n=1 Tax=Azospirillum halopraeferens TaxID=34010 RepID=UPI000403A4CC|nr:tripartite tricarboxylate transporter substrate binding protein [Azospirillum halopraeferens]
MLKEKLLALGAAVGVGALSLSVAATPASAASWKPEKPVTIVVPWGAGGSTDQIVRLVAVELEKELGQKFVIVNQPGAQGAIGTRSVMEAPRDGYTWASGAAKDIGTYGVSGLADTKLTDWHLFLAVVNTSVLSVNADTPYQTAEELVNAMKAKPGTVTVATAGVNSSGGAAVAALSNALGVEVKQVTYDGGNPATIATAGGETVATTQLAADQAEMIRARKIRPLAVLGGRTLTLDGVGEIPPITRFYPDYPVADDYFGLFIPRGVPQEVVDTVAHIWSKTIDGSEALQRYGAQKGSIPAVVMGEEAYAAAMPSIQKMAYGMVERGQAKADPATLGIPKP